MTTPAEVLLLGTFHMANPGRDLINLVADDVLAEHRQAELQEMCANLARFRPTKICVEYPVGEQATLDDAFARYLGTDAEPNRNEIFQVGFRLAAMCGLDRVHAIDDPTPMEWTELQDHLARNPADDALFKEQVARSQEEVRRSSEELVTTPLRDFLLRMNETEELRKGAAWYVDLVAAGGIGEHGGADMLASWYRRNLRIFSNLSGITAESDRIFVLFGWGHIPILRSLVDLSSRHRLVEAHDFL